MSVWYQNEAVSFSSDFSTCLQNMNTAAVTFAYQYLLYLYNVYQEYLAQQHPRRRYWIHPINQSRFAVLLFAVFSLLSKFMN